MLIVFIGPPGAGKGTQSNLLTRHFNIPHVSTGEMLRRARSSPTPLGREITALIDSGKLVPDPVVFELVGRRLSEPDCTNGCLFDGFPRTIGQAESLDDYLAERGAAVDVALELKADTNELARRMLARAVIEHRADDTPETIRQRFEVYTRQTTPLLEYYHQQGKLRTIDAMGPPNEVFANIITCLDALRNKVAH